MPAALVALPTSSYPYTTDEIRAALDIFEAWEFTSEVYTVCDRPLSPQSRLLTTRLVDLSHGYSEVLDLLTYAFARRSYAASKGITDNTVDLAQSALTRILEEAADILSAISRELEEG